MADRMEEYLRTVGEQVRWKRARLGLLQELRSHLLDQRDAYLVQGMDEESAQRESVRQMGDPVEVGTALDRIHRPKPQWGLLLLVGALLCMGYMAQCLLREVAVVDGMVTETFYESRWLVSAAVGAVVMLVVYVLDYTTLGRRPLWNFCVGVLLLAVVYHCSRTVAGKLFEIQYWMLFAPVLLAVLVYGLRGRGWLGFVLSVGTTLLLAAFACLIPNLTLAVLILCAGLIVVAVAVVRGWMGMGIKKGIAAFGGVIALLVMLFCRFVLSNHSISRRIQVAFHPELDPLGKGYQAMVIRALLADAKWVGQGDVTYAGYESAERLLPAIPTDSLLTWMIHRLGWVAGLVLMGIFVLLLGWMARKAWKQRGMLGCLISVAVFFTLAAQVGSYVLFNLGFCLSGVLSLPLVSYGHWGVVINMALIGLVLSVFRGEALSLWVNKCGGEPPSPHLKLVFWRDGDLVIGFSRLKSMKKA